jgi:hypothetical protein
MDGVMFVIDQLGNTIQRLAAENEQLRTQLREATIIPGDAIKADRADSQHPSGMGYGSDAE